MKTYDKYKDVSLSVWLSEIPQNWEYTKMKYIFSEHSEKGHPDEPLLVASQNMGVVLKNIYGSRTVEAQKDLQLLKFVGIGDFVISLRSFQGGIEYAYYQGIISPAYTILTPQNSSFAGYLKYLLKSYDFISLLKLCVTGIREGQNIDYSKLRDFKIPIPPQEEQTQIVRFLDWKISEINKLIALYKNQIERLEELKRTVVSRAVTRGLNYDVKMKDSGVGWIGEIPEHWGVTKVKRKCKLTGSGTTPTTGNSDFYNGDIAWIQSGDLYHTAFVERTEKSLTELALQEYSVLAVYTPPFLVIAMYGASIGNASISYISACVNQACCVLIPTDDMDIRFMRYWLEFCKNDFIRQSEGGTQPNISQKKVREEIIVVIPKEEQRLIADYLESKNSQINAAIENKKQQIQRIQELRTRLISDVVTGKIDVRGIQIPEYGFVAESINEEIDEAGCEEQEDEYE